MKCDNEGGDDDDMSLYVELSLKRVASPCALKANFLDTISSSIYFSQICDFCHAKRRESSSNYHQITKTRLKVGGV